MNVHAQNYNREIDNNNSKMSSNTLKSTIVTPIMILTRNEKNRKNKRGICSEIETKMIHKK